MRKVEIKTCRKCRRTYLWESGGITSTPQEHMDLGLCEKCRAKEVQNSIGRILGRKK